VAVESREPVGVLVITVWPQSDDGTLVAQLSAIAGLDEPRRERHVAGDVEALVAEVAQWLTAVSAGTAPPW
jgi:hypothetical protein